MSDEPAFILTAEARPTEIRKHKRITWQPQLDITALELAKLVPLLLAMGTNPADYWEDYIPAEAKRHFEIKDQ